ncbi:hypothetical protein [Ekhidna sp.]
MKKSVLIISACIVASVAFGQRFVTTTYIEQTSVSPKTGIAIGAINQYGIEYGGFYQESKLAETVLMSQEEVSRLPRKYEKVFYGAYVAFPILSYSKAGLKFNVRTGVTNGENFAITPSLLANYNLTKSMSLGGGLGVRALAPTLQTRVTITL